MKLYQFVTGGSIAMDPDPSAGPYTWGQVVDITATPSFAWQFDGWYVTGLSTLTDSTNPNSMLVVGSDFTRPAASA